MIMDQITITLIYDKILGRVLNKSIFDPETNYLIAKSNTQIDPDIN